MKLSAEHEAEQKELTEFVQTEQNAVHIFEQDRADFDNFATVIRKYVGVKELTPTIVNEFVKKIFVHAPDKSSGHRRQKVLIVWNFIREDNLPGDSQVIERQKKAERHNNTLYRPAITLPYHCSRQCKDAHFFISIESVRIPMSCYYLLSAYTTPR